MRLSDVNMIMPRPLTTVGELTLAELKAIATGWDQKVLSDLDFIQTLATHKCLLAPPYVVRLHGNGHAEAIVRLSYDRDLNLDKPRILLAVLRAIALEPAETTHIIHR